MSDASNGYVQWAYFVYDTATEPWSYHGETGATVMMPLCKTKVI